MDPGEFNKQYEQDLVNRTQLGFTGFIDPETMTDDDLARWYDQNFPSESSGSAAHSESSGSATRPSKKCQHGRCCGGFFCRDCFDDHNATNRLFGKPDQAWKGYCQHGILYNTTKSCQEPQCQKKPRPYKKTQSPFVASTASAHEGNMGGGSKSYRKSSRKLKKKAKRSSRKAKRSSRKAKRSSSSRR